MQGEAGVCEMLGDVFGIGCCRLLSTKMPSDLLICFVFVLAFVAKEGGRFIDDCIEDDDDDDEEDKTPG